MSITFTTEMSPIVEWAVTDRAGGREQLDTYDEAVARMVAVRDHGAILNGARPTGDAVADHRDMHDAVIIELIEADPAPEINVSNRNAFYLLRALGVTDPDYSGTMKPADFLGRVLIAEAISPSDAGVPAYAVTERFIDCGRSEGYLHERLTQLRELADWAIEHQREEICWS
jgi:hypothetical protein